MIGFNFLIAADHFTIPPPAGGGPETSPEVEITAESGIELDVGDGAMLTES